MRKSILKLSILLCFVLGLVPGVREINSLAEEALDGGELRRSVVKLFVHTDSPDFFKPWSKLGTEFRTGSGSVVSGNRILTNAHLVTDHTFIQVRKYGEPTKYEARLEAMGHDCDLAILTVEDPQFFKGTQALELGGLPKLQDRITVIGYPIGGDQLSVTEGVVSRIDVIPYVHSARSLLAVQIDAAINPGNSGGPAIQEGKLVGIAFSTLRGGENIGYLVPSPIIEHFFADLRDGRYEGFPELGLVYNDTESPSLQKFYHPAGGGEGVLVTGISSKSPVKDSLKVGDILSRIDGVQIASDGTIPFREKERILFIHKLSEKQIGEELRLDLLREGKTIAVSLKLGPYIDLVPPFQHFQEPTYYIYGGLVFSILSNDLLGGWDHKRYGLDALLNFNYYNRGPGRLLARERGEIPILLEVLPDDVNVGYHEVRFQVVAKINGKPVLSFKDLVTALETSKESYTKIETEDFVTIVLDRAKVREANARIAKKYRIRSLYSEDVASWIVPKALPSP